MSMRTRGPRLGEILEQQGAVTREQLLRALRNQKVVGGKLGTCLLEIDAVSEESLLKALAEQQNAEPVAPDELRTIGADVLALVPPKVAKVHRAVPFRATGTQIQVAMIDARDLRALDELAFITGRRVRAHVGSEARIFEAIEKYYGQECPPRFVKLLDRLNRSRYLWRAHEERAAAAARDPDAGGPAWAPQVGEHSPAAPLVTEPIATPLPEAPAPLAFTSPSATPPGVERAAPPPATAAPAPPVEAPESIRPLGLAEAERLLQNPQDADSVAAVLVDFAAPLASAVALFQARKSGIAGWRGHRLDQQQIAAFRLRLDRPSLFFALKEGAAMHRGPLPELEAHTGLRALLGERAHADLVVLPLRVRDRFAGALLVAPRDATVPPEELGQLQRVVARASLALELCVMRNKLKQS